MSFNAQRKLEAPVVSGVTLDRNVVRLSLSQLPVRQGMVAVLFEKIAATGVKVGTTGVLTVMVKVVVVAHCPAAVGNSGQYAAR